jgi:hypothetical protein
MQIDKPIKLCRRGSCCPTVTLTPFGEYRITDDYKGSVLLTKEEITDLFLNLVKDDNFCQLQPSLKELLSTIVKAIAKSND